MVLWQAQKWNRMTTEKRIEFMDHLKKILCFSAGYAAAFILDYVFAVGSAAEAACTDD